VGAWCFGERPYPDRGGLALDDDSKPSIRGGADADIDGFTNVNTFAYPIANTNAATFSYTYSHTDASCSLADEAA
jgi:hypothetical protein